MVVLIGYEEIKGVILFFVGLLTFGAMVWLGTTLYVGREKVIHFYTEAGILIIIIAFLIVVYAILDSIKK